MAQRILVTVECDLDPTDDRRTGQTVQFWDSDGTAHELDLCEEHIVELQDTLDAIDGWAKQARRSTIGPNLAVGKRKRGAGANTGAKQSGIDPKVVRAWATAQGIEVSTRGRLNASVMEQYHAANP